VRAREREAGVEDIDVAIEEDLIPHQGVDGAAEDRRSMKSRCVTPFLPW
jgi:hypothetical protein